MSSLLILACLGGLALVALIVYAVGKGVGGDWSDGETAPRYRPALRERAHEWNRILNQDRQEVRQTAVGFQPLGDDGRPDGSFKPYIPTPDGTPTWSRVTRKGKRT